MDGGNEGPMKSVKLRDRKVASAPPGHAGGGWDWWQLCQLATHVGKMPVRKTGPQFTRPPNRRSAFYPCPSSNVK